MKIPFTVLVFMAFCIGCGSTQSAMEGQAASTHAEFQGEYPIQAVATVGMVADIVRNVGADHLAVAQIMGAGVDPHLYKATRDDVQTLMNGDIVFYSGLMLEGKMTDTLIKMARRKPVVAVTEQIDESYLLEPDDFQGHYDPHVWMDVSAWSYCVEAIANSLIKFDPVHASEYRANAKKYCQELAALHEYGVASIGSIAEGSRVLITSHDAFNYFGRAYGLDVLGIQGISTESEAGLMRINDLVDLLVAKNVRAVFVESSVSSKNIEALVEGARSKNHDIVIGGELFSDAMGKADAYEGTYIGMLDHNITLVTIALGGDAPATGFHGKLSTPDEVAP